MSTYYPKPKVEVSLTTHSDLGELPIWTADLPQWAFGTEDQNPDWLPEDKTIDGMLRDNTAHREGDELVIDTTNYYEQESSEIRVHKDNLKIVDGPEFSDIPTEEDYKAAA